MGGEGLAAQGVFIRAFLWAFKGNLTYKMSHFPSKDEIIRLIKELAEESGGKSPGRAQFEAATGISVTSLMGRYWIGWSEALIEAGFAPNQMAAKIPEGQVIDAYISCMSHYKSIPSSNQYKLFRRSHPELPSASIYDKYSQLSLVKMAQDRLQMSSDHEELIVICEDYIRSKSPAVSQASAPSTQKSGWVYMFKHGARREYKIGKTTNPIKREGQIKVELPDAVTPVHTIETDDPTGVEAYWHRRFDTKRKNGEWFELTTSDVAAFKRWKKIF